MTDELVSVHEEISRRARLRLQTYQRNLNQVGRGRDQWEMILGRPGVTLWDFVRKNLKSRRIPQTVLANANQIASNAPISAEIVHNRWIAQCECMGAEVVDRDIPIFFCLSCFNTEIEGKTRPVIFPSQINAIENTLLLRPNPMNRNWRIGETVADLQAENDRRGLGGS